MIRPRVTWGLRWLFLGLTLLFVAQAGFGKKKPPIHPINLNTASALELQQVPGIGPSIANKILQMRKSYDAFKSVDDLLAIKGIGPKRLDKMRKYLVAGKTAQNKKAAGSAESAAVAGKAPPAKSAVVKAVPAQKATAEPKVKEEEEP
ncbi:MAG TPA: helix-hairpin-helix domain-containing protein [Candidatus Acidoferrum sp.]|jgi:competence ComEA-like helix-hairpin-helix protein